MAVRVRFAPSPTGHVHIGNIRVAIFNWLFARNKGGAFLLRVEDTDRERSTDEAINGLLDVMEWLGLQFDESVFYQSQHADEHTAAARRLVANGHAYQDNDDDDSPIIFRIPWQLDQLPFVRPAGRVTLDLHPETPLTLSHRGLSYAQVSRKGKPIPQDGCLAGFHGLRVHDSTGHCLFELEPSLSEIRSGARTEQIDGGVSMTFDRHEVVYRDVVKGELTKPIDGMKDLVIVRSNGTPVFHLANVCDDIQQGITHIIRGDDHIENTYRHLFLFHALGATIPNYASLPMIVNAAGKPYSKRDGDAYVGDFRTKGFLPEALFNYLALLGWSPGDDREQMRQSELIDAFGLDRVRSAPSQMDIGKLTNLNGLYVAEMAPGAFRECAFRYCTPTWTEPDGKTPVSAHTGQFAAACALNQSRTKLFTQVPDWSYLFVDDISYDEKAVRKNLQKAGVAEALALLEKNLTTTDWTLADIEDAVHRTTDTVDIKQGKLNLPIRIAMTGVAVGAGIYEIMELLGRSTVCKRLHHAMSLCTAPAPEAG